MRKLGKWFTITSKIICAQLIYFHIAHLVWVTWLIIHKLIRKQSSNLLQGDKTLLILVTIMTICHEWLTLHSGRHIDPAGGPHNVTTHCSVTFHSSAIKWGNVSYDCAGAVLQREQLLQPVLRGSRLPRDQVRTTSISRVPTSSKWTPITKSLY